MSQSTGLGLRYAAVSDVGRVRKDNQDSGYAGPHLLVVADGVGGAARGDVASRTAVASLRRLDEPASDDPLEAVAGAIHRAHDKIAELVEQDPGLEGTSTTVTTTLFDGTRICVGHVGDSRAYLLREGSLSQLTKDHTFVQGLIDEGRLTEQEARVHPHRNLILRAVDGVHETEPDLFLVDLAEGDRLLLCSDGCSGVLDPDRIADILGSGSLDYAAVELVRAALDAGSSDNVTCLVAEVVDQDAAAHAADGSAAGPLLVGAAADQSRRAGRGLFRGHRSGDTGELEPVGGTPAGEVGEEIDPEELRYAPRAPRRLLWLRRIAVVVVLALVVAGLAFAAYRWSQTQYYVAADQEEVTIFRGVPADLPGVRLSSVYQGTGVALGDLPDYRARQVRGGIDASDLDDARAIVTRLEGLAQRCASAESSPSPSSSASKRSQRAARSPSPGASAKSAPTRTRGTASPGAGSGTRRPSASSSPSTTPAPPPAGCGSR